MHQLHHSHTAFVPYVCVIDSQATLQTASTCSTVHRWPPRLQLTHQHRHLQAVLVQVVELVLVLIATERIPPWSLPPHSRAGLMVRLLVVLWRQWRRKRRTTMSIVMVMVTEMETPVPKCIFGIVLEPRPGHPPNDPTVLQGQRRCYSTVQHSNRNRNGCEQ